MSGALLTVSDVHAGYLPGVDILRGSHTLHERVLPILTLEAARNRGAFGMRLFKRNSLAQAPDHTPVVGAAAGQPLEEFARYPDIRIVRESEAGGQHSEDRHGIVRYGQLDPG